MKQRLALQRQGKEWLSLAKAANSEVRQRLCEVAHNSARARQGRAKLGQGEAMRRHSKGKAKWSKGWVSCRGAKAMPGKAKVT